jgi:hypothetical protein
MLSNFVEANISNDLGIIHQSKVHINWKKIIILLNCDNVINEIDKNILMHSILLILTKGTVCKER